jgi:hypothetical protein
MTDTVNGSKQLTIHAQQMFPSTVDFEKLVLSGTARCPVLSDPPLRQIWKHFMWKLTTFNIATPYVIACCFFIYLIFHFYFQFFLSDKTFSSLEYVRY